MVKPRAARPTLRFVDEYVVGLDNEQGLHHRVNEISLVGVSITSNSIETDFAIYGLFQGMILPLCFEVYKPKDRLKARDEHRSKPEIAVAMIRELIAMGFHFELVLADSLYGESRSNFISVLESLQLPFTRTFSNGQTEVRYRQEIIFGTRRSRRYWLLTTDPETLLDNSTVYVMSNAPEVKLDEIGDAYGYRTWIEYELKQSKDALGWADFRGTNYKQIERWWEIVMSAFTMVSLFADAFNQECPLSHQVFAQHPWWDNQRGWKNLLVDTL